MDDRWIIELQIDDSSVDNSIHQSIPQFCTSIIHCVHFENFYFLLYVFIVLYKRCWFQLSDFEINTNPSLCKTVPIWPCQVNITPKIMAFSETNSSRSDPRSAKPAAVMQYDVPFHRNSSAIWNILSIAQRLPQNHLLQKRHLLTQNEKHWLCNDFSVSFIHALGVIYNHTDLFCPACCDWWINVTDKPAFLLAVWFSSDRRSQWTYDQMPFWWKMMSFPSYSKTEDVGNKLEWLNCCITGWVITH